MNIHPPPPSNVLVLALTIALCQTYSKWTLFLENYTWCCNFQIINSKTVVYLEVNFFSTGNRKKSPRPVVGDVLHTLKAAMSLLRRCRVNPALTIQLFSQVFHFVNMWLFNRIVLEPQLRLCTRSWGMRLRARLARLQDWAESQGLELAAECHLARISQVRFKFASSKITFVGTKASPCWEHVEEGPLERAFALKNEFLSQARICSCYKDNLCCNKLIIATGKPHNDIKIFMLCSCVHNFHDYFLGCIVATTSQARLNCHFVTLL